MLLNFEVYLNTKYFSGDCETVVSDRYKQKATLLRATYLEDGGGEHIAVVRFFLMEGGGQTAGGMIETKNSFMNSPNYFRF